MTTTATPKIVGNALYLELVPNPDLTEEQQNAVLGWRKAGVKQIVLFPEYQDDTGRTKNAVIMSRELSTYSPRAQWDLTIGRAFPKPIDPDKLAEAYANTSGYSWVQYDDYTKAEWDALTEKEKADAKTLWLDLQMRNQLLSSGWVKNAEGEREELSAQAWVVREGKPIAVEITDEDYRLLHDHTTPQAVIRRINKVRESLDKFPTKLV